MFQESEVAAAVVTVAILMSLLFFRSHIRRLPSGRLLLVAFCLLALRCLATIAEGFVLPDIFNWLEHLFLVLTAVFLALWCWNVLIKKRV